MAAHSGQAQRHGRDVVAPGTAERSIEQACHQRGGLMRAPAVGGDLGVAEFLVDSIRAQQVVLARPARAHHPIHIQRIVGADRAGERTAGGLRSPHLGHIVLVAGHMVAGQQLQPALLERIGAAIAHPAAHQQLVVVHQHHHGAGDHIHSSRARQCTQLPVDLAQLRVDGIDEPGQVAVAPQRAQCINDHATGEIAGAVAAQSIGHCPQAQIVAQQNRILVPVTDIALFGTPGGHVRRAHCTASARQALCARKGPSRIGA